MIPRRQDRINRESNLDNFLSISEATTLTPRSQRVEVVTVADAADFAITLPNVSEAAGCLISIALVTLGDDEVVTVQDQDESYDWSDLTLDALNDGVLLYSDGHKWWVICNDIAA
jgi:hypothetical protein